MDPIKKLEFFNQKLNEIEEKIDENNVTQDVFLNFIDVQKDIDHMDTQLTTEKEKEFYHNVRNRTVSVAKKMPFEFESLPVELQLFVTSMLAPKDLAEMSKVSQSMKGLAEDEAIWKKQVLSNPKMKEAIEKSGGLPKGVTWKEFYRDFSPFEKNIGFFFDLIKLLPEEEGGPIDKEALKSVVDSDIEKQYISDEQKEILFANPRQVEDKLYSLINEVLDSLENEEDYIDRMFQFLVGPKIYGQAYEIEGELNLASDYGNLEEILSNYLREISGDVNRNAVKGTDSYGRQFFAVKTTFELPDEHQTRYLIIRQEYNNDKAIIINHFGHESGWNIDSNSSKKLEALRTLFSTGEVVTDITERRPEGTKTTLFKS